MASKCCKSKPPCKDCPKRKKQKSKIEAACCGQPEKTAKFEMRYFAPADISISGQRGWMAKAPAGLAGVPA